MKYPLVVLIAVLITTFASGQKRYLDSLNQLLKDGKQDTANVLALSALADYYGFNQFDSSILYARKTIDLSEKVSYPYGSFLGLRSLFYAYNCQGNYSGALEATLQNFKIAEKIKKERPFCLASVHYMLGVLNREMENFQAAIFQFRRSIQLSEESEGPDFNLFANYSHLALIYQKLKRPDSALWCAQKGYDLCLKSKFIRFISLASLVLGNIYNESGQFELAKRYFTLGAQQSRMYNNTYFLAKSYNSLADLLNKTGHPDSCIYYARISLQLCQQHNFNEYGLDASSLLTKAFESQNKTDSTYKYMKIMLAVKDSVFSPSKMQKFQQFVFNEEQRQQQIQKAQEQYKNRIKTYASLFGMIALLTIAFILWRNNRQKQKSKTKIEEAYEELKSTQAQLIQQEKMASLGELTAGIAHEIQNPLNFVNNFSEVNRELVDELQAELKAGNTEDAIAISNDLKENEQKINHHGKRADAIVKGMLQHSQKSTGKKEPTDINKLADEYLRLSYHGMRAKDKLFNAALQTDFDENIGTINITPQDIGRVILNLYNNAFYAVAEKMKQQDGDYEPTVSVSTKKLNDKIEIRVEDNGNGIPQNIVDKIFQPFFTTKPTGQGTGLGLSLSYDIIKAHGGEIKVETKEGEGSVFTMTLTLV